MKHARYINAIVFREADVLLESIDFSYTNFSTATTTTPLAGLKPTSSPAMREKRGYKLHIPVMLTPTLYHELPSRVSDLPCPAPTELWQDSCELVQPAVPFAK